MLSKCNHAFVNKTVKVQIQNLFTPKTHTLIHLQLTDALSCLCKSTHTHNKILTQEADHLEKNSSKCGLLLVQIFLFPIVNP